MAPATALSSNSPRLTKLTAFILVHVWWLYVGGWARPVLAAASRSPMRLRATTWFSSAVMTVAYALSMSACSPPLDVSQVHLVLHRHW